MENGDQGSGSDPSAFLAEITGVPVTVKLNSGVVYKDERQIEEGNEQRDLEWTELNQDDANGATGDFSQVKNDIFQD
ncbi:MAG: hypothetical protein Q9160_005792 [Pyrenula sp. 1 TL-2023]